MQNSKHIIAKLIINYIRGNLNELQERELNKWLSDVENKRLFDEIIDKENILNKSYIYDNFDKNKSRKRINNYINNQKNQKKQKLASWIIYAVAASIVVSIGFAVFRISFSDIEKQQLTQNTNKITPGSNNAVIYFANGQTVDLSKDSSTLIKSGDGVAIQRNNNVLTVKADKTSNQSPKMNKIVTPIGGDYQLVLSDGTKVWLNADSELEFPATFTGNKRKVSVKGELYFDVSTNKNKPFVVNTSDNIQVQVLGTQINIKSYKNDKTLTATLIEGAMQVNYSNKKTIKLKAGNKVTFNKKSKLLKESPAHINEIIAWKNNMFMFENKPLEEIIINLQRWYNFTVIYDNDKIKEKRFSLECKRSENFKTILKYLIGTKEVKFAITENTVTVYE